MNHDGSRSNGTSPVHSCSPVHPGHGQQAVALRPQHALYRNNLASVLVVLGRTDEAYAQLAAVHGKAVAHYNLGYMLQRRGSKDLAVAQFELALAADPSLEAAQQWLAALQAEAGPSQLAQVPQEPRPDWSDLPEDSAQVAGGPDGGASNDPREPPAPTPDDFQHQPFENDWPAVESVDEHPAGNFAPLPRRY